ncbi:Phosphatidylinositol transfer protein SFH5 [Yarrowia lipolytica]|nr:Phosphatidylinositol transfer protein SFH5 [Yarrowia lipolytica]
MCDVIGLTLESSLHLLTPDQLSSLAHLQISVPELCKTAHYAEIYGHHLLPDQKCPGRYSEKARDVILLKVLESENYDATKAGDKLLTVLRWRKDYKPMDEDRDLPVLDGHVTTVAATNLPQTTLWHRSSATHIPNSIYIRWKVGLIEQAISTLDFSSPDNSSKLTCVEDFNHNMYDEVLWKQLSTLREFYPGIFDKTFFVNVPLSLRIGLRFFNKSNPVYNRRNSVILGKGKELKKHLGNWVPREYGGEGPGLEIQGRNVRGYSAYEHHALRHVLTPPTSPTQYSHAKGDAYRDSYGPPDDDDVPPYYH